MGLKDIIIKSLKKNSKNINETEEQEDEEEM